MEIAKANLKTEKEILAFLLYLIHYIEKYEIWANTVIKIIEGENNNVDDK